VRHGHREAQDLFLEIGEGLGYVARKTYSSEHPSDGVWLLGNDSGLMAGMPAAAIEVLVSESAKSISGSIHRLESISPALAIVLLHEEEIRRRLTRLGFNDRRIDGALARDTAYIDAQIQRSKQRLQRWSFAQLQWAWRQVAIHQHHNIGTGPTARQFS
jgi:hypothetical protein